MVGDDDQSIYGWRGANVGIILEFQEHFPQAAVVKTRAQHYSTAKIIECAFGSSARRDPRRQRLWTANRPVITWWSTGHQQEEEADWVAETIDLQVRAGRARFGDHAVLA